MAANNDRLYRTLRFLGSPWSYKVNGLEHIHRDQPAVYITNHLESLGPISVVLALPIRLYPWISAEMLDSTRAPDYLYNDFVKPTLRWRGAFGRGFARSLAQITVPLLKGIGCIAVESGKTLSIGCFRRSLELLDQGASLLIFPEDENQPADPQTGTHPFLGGFVQLCLLYQKQVGVPLAVHAMAVHPPSQSILIDAASTFDHSIRRRAAIDAACVRVRHRVQELYLQQEGGDVRLMEEYK